jgi:8-oxo-dGTP diphosphatase
MTSSFSFDYFGSVITATPLGVDFVPSKGEVITSACVTLTEDKKIVAVDVIGRGIDIPGGHIDPGETAVDAMRREAFEEAYIKVDAPTLIDVLKVTSDDKRLGLEEKPYMLIYAAKVSEIQDFIVNDEISQRLIMTREEFVSNYFANHDYARNMIDAAVRALRF